ncbi:ankyrin repeat domain-containing protein [bacterium]|nr:ankyrin repeat domain-containing protein [bacterium]
MCKYSIYAAFSLLILLTAGCSKGTLHEAIRSRDVSRVKALLDSGADANGVDDYGLTALCAAAYEGPSDMAKLLIDHGADVDLCAHVVDGKHQTSMCPLTMTLERHGRRKGGRTPADYAALALLLIDNGADVNVVDIDGGSNGPLHYATFSKGVTESLIEHGANVNAKNSQGDTPLHDAIRVGYMDVIPILLNHGADPMIPNNNGKTPLDFARDEKRSSVVSLIEKHLQEEGGNP